MIARDIAPLPPLTADEAAQLAQTARLQPEDRFGVLVSLWVFWAAVVGTAPPGDLTAPIKSGQGALDTGG